jgi:hypothetical protein
LRDMRPLVALIRRSFGTFVTDAFVFLETCFDFVIWIKNRKAGHRRKTGQIGQQHARSFGIGQKLVQRVTA